MARRKATPCDTSTLPRPMGVTETAIRNAKQIDQWTEAELAERLQEIGEELEQANRDYARFWNIASRAIRIHDKYHERHEEARRRAQRAYDECRVIHREIGLRRTMPTIQERSD